LVEDFSVVGTNSIFIIFLLKQWGHSGLEVWGLIFTEGILAPLGDRKDNYW